MPGSASGWQRCRACRPWRRRRWLAARALPTRPALAGALYGLGAGLMADAGVRLFCWVSAPAHVLVAHGGAILCLAAAGALAATVIERMKERSRARRG